ncbi:MAG TPA: hypothetical protein VD788_11175, partial [Candidatus Polarisedimenticolaceae bacterium]|nr:hypothetical protein [Candidatus Polarisedimenticolaceae bacterium]
MKPTLPPDDRPVSSDGSRLLPPTLAIVLVLLPPETRGESAAGCAALVLLLVMLAARRTLPAWVVWLPIAGTAAVVPELWLGQAPGAVVEPLAHRVLAASAGLAVATIGIPTEERSRFPLALAVAAAVAATFGLYQVVWGFERIVEGIRQGGVVADAARVVARTEAGRAFAAFPTPAALGGLLILSLPITIGAALARRGAARAAVVVLAALQAAGLLATASVTAVGGLAAALVVWGVRRAGRSSKRAVVAGLAATAAVAVVVVMRGPAVTDLGAP